MKTQGFLLKYPDGKSEIGTNGNLSTKDLTAITWQELKDKRDAGKLTPGALYRITDYNCTTTQENTISVGHLFDIVLLALSENKLAEEGWAMNHESDTPSLEPTGTTYYKWTGYELSTLREVERWTTSPNPQYQDPVYELLTEGFYLTGEVRSVSEQEVICSDGRLYNLHLTTLTKETMFVPDEEEDTGDYFQNSNLSAWRVWYSLDNDTDRFAWADDSVDGGNPATMVIEDGKGDLSTTRNPIDDMIVNNIQYYAWEEAWEEGGNTYNYYTLSQTPETGDDTFEYDTYNEVMANWYPVKSYTPAHEGTGLSNGRGVIYRLIDEFNNDCPYDFKNILHIINVKFEDPVINYTFYNSELDLSLNSTEIIVYNNYISPITETFGNGSTLYIIPTITIGETSNNNRIYGKNIGLVNAKNVVLIGSSDLSLGSLLKGVGPTIYIGNTEIVGSLPSISDENIGGGEGSR